MFLLLEYYELNENYIKNLANSTYSIIILMIFI